jgi:AcrR family transcriptional regulator
LTGPFTNKKYLQILATARDLFWKHGFRRISIEEVCQQAKVSKMTFYRFFPNKIELAKAVFDREMTVGLKKFREILAEDSSSAEKIRKMVLLELEGSHNMSREFLQDFYGDREVELKGYIEERSQQSWNEVLEDFRMAQARGWFRSDLNPEFLFYFSKKVGEMLTDEKLLALYPSASDLVMEITNFISYGISPRNRDEESVRQV